MLNRLRWDAGATASEAALTYRVREGREEREEEVPFSAVVEILPLGLTLADGTFLPYHRVVAVHRGGEALWRSQRR